MLNCIFFSVEKVLQLVQVQYFLCRKSDDRSRNLISPPTYPCLLLCCILGHNHNSKFFFSLITQLVPLPHGVFNRTATSITTCSITRRPAQSHGDLLNYTVTCSITRRPAQSHGEPLDQMATLSITWRFHQMHGVLLNQNGELFNHTASRPSLSHSSFLDTQQLPRTECNFNLHSAMS